MTLYVGCGTKQIILDPDDQPMWESAKTVASTPNSAIVQINVDDNFVINSTYLNMIRENKFNGYLRADPHDSSVNFSQSATCSNMVKLKAKFLDESTQAILDETIRGIFLYKSTNQAFQFLDDKFLFNLDCSNKLQMKLPQKSIIFADESDSNTDILD
ncbi:hypothetical protein Tco_0344886 [Tanacetum coccineum]